MKKLLSIVLIFTLIFTSSAYLFADDGLPADADAVIEDVLIELEEEDVPLTAEPSDLELEEDVEEVLEEEFAASSVGLVPGITIKRAQVLSGGEHQVLWRNAERWDISEHTVYKGDHPTLAVNGEDPNLFYTTARTVNLQDPRRFTLEVVVPKGDFTGIGAGNGEFNLANVTITYTSNNTQTLVPAGTRVNSAVIEGDFIVIEAVIETTGVGLQTAARTNTPYLPYYNARRPSAANWNRIGYWPLRVSYTGVGVIAEKQLRTSYNDSIQRWREVDVWAKDYVTKWPEGGTEYSELGRFMKVESFGKSTQGRDLWAFVISDSKESVDEYLNVTIPLMNDDPAEMQRQIEAGTFDHRGVIMFNAMHGNEVAANGILVDMRERLMHNDRVRFSVRAVEDTRWIAPTSNTNAAGGTRIRDGVPRDKVIDEVVGVDELLEDYIIVIMFWTNPDGNEGPVRTNNFSQDPNRDGGMFNFRETQHSIAYMTKWDPIYFMELHDDVATFQNDGCTPPTEASLEADLIDNYMIDLLEALGYAAIGNAFNHFNIPTRDMVSDWDAASLIYSASMAMMNGALGSTLEFPGTNQDANDSGLQGFFGVFRYMLDERDGLYHNKLEFKRRGVENIDAKDKVDPLLKSVHWRFEERRGTPGFAWLAASVDMPRPRLRDADGNELSFFPEYWVLPVDRSLQYSPQNAVEALVALQEWGGVKIERTTQQVVGADGVVYPVGTYVIPMHQGRRSFANSVLYFGFDTANFSGLYDPQTVVSWTALRGFNAIRTWESGLFKGKTEPVDIVKQIDLPGNGEFVIYANAGLDAIRLTNRLLDNGRDVWMVTNYIPGAALGDFVARRADVLEMVQTRNNAQWGPLALSVFGVDGGSEPPAEAAATQLRRPIIAITRPGTSAIARFMYDSLEFNNFANNSTAAGAVWVGSGTPPNTTIPAFMWNAAAANVVAANALGAGAVASGNPTGFVELVGRGTWASSSIVAANYGPKDFVYSYTLNKYINPRSNVKVLGQFVTVPGTGNNAARGSQIYLGGRRGLINSPGFSGRITAVSGVRANGTGVTAITEDITTRGRYQAMWHLMGSSIFAYAAGIADVPRPVVSADATNADWTLWDNSALDVQLNILAEDTAGINATVAAKKFMVSTAPLAPVYDVADVRWKDIPEDDKVTIDVAGVQYLHWYVENSKGVSSQGTFGPYMINGIDFLSTTTSNFVSMTETANNSREWVLTFNYVETYLDGTIRVLPYSINLNGNNANLDGSFRFTDGPLAGYTLVYDIKGNGSNIKDLRLIK